MNCDTCLFYEYDEEYECYTCSKDLDARMMQHQECPFWRDGDEYKTVRKQM